MLHSILTTDKINYNIEKNQKLFIYFLKLKLLLCLKSNLLFNIAGPFQLITIQENQLHYNTSLRVFSGSISVNIFLLIKLSFKLRLIGIKCKYILKSRIKIRCRFIRRRVLLVINIILYGSQEVISDYFILNLYGRDKSLSQLNGLVISVLTKILKNQIRRQHYGEQ